MAIGYLVVIRSALKVTNDAQRADIFPIFAI